MIAAIRWVARLGLGVGVIGVVVLSLTPTASLPPHPDIWDKAQHFLAYGALGVCGAIGFAGMNAVKRVAGCLVLLGAGLEVGQLFVAGRDGTLGDAFANGLGVGVGIVAVLLVRRINIGAQRPA
ncbi:MAG: VanZ family protein [Alphaproteobacteria bacterium]